MITGTITVRITKEFHQSNIPAGRRIGNIVNARITDFHNECFFVDWPNDSKGLCIHEDDECIVEVDMNIVK